MDISNIRIANLLSLIASKAANSQKDFANIADTSPAYLSQIINGTVGKNGKPAAVGNSLARKIEKAFSLDHGWMDVIHRSDFSENSFDKSKKLDNNIDLSNKIDIIGRRIPVISWVAAGAFSGVDTVICDAEIDEWLPPNEDCGRNGYGLIIVGSSMSPHFIPADRIYVNPDIQTFDLKTNDLVIVSCAGDTEATFKRLIIEGSNQYLQPLNPDWPEQIIQLSEGCRLVGRVVGLYRKI